jgi:hypothetical protein
MTVPLTQTGCAQTYIHQVGRRIAHPVAINFQQSGCDDLGKFRTYIVCLSPSLSLPPYSSQKTRQAAEAASKKPNLTPQPIEK